MVAIAKAVAAFLAAPANSLAPALKAFSPSAEASRAASAAFWNSPKILLTPGISLVKSAKSSNNLVSLLIFSKVFCNLSAKSKEASIFSF